MARRDSGSGSGGFGKADRETDRQTDRQRDGERRLGRKSDRSVRLAVWGCFVWDGLV